MVRDRVVDSLNRSDSDPWRDPHGIDRNGKGDRRNIAHTCRTCNNEDEDRQVDEQDTQRDHESVYNPLDRGICLGHLAPRRNINDGHWCSTKIERWFPNVFDFVPGRKPESASDICRRSFYLEFLLLRFLLARRWIFGIHDELLICFTEMLRTESDLMVKIDESEERDYIDSAGDKCRPPTRVWCVPCLVDSSMIRIYSVVLRWDLLVPFSDDSIVEREAMLDPHQWHSWCYLE